MLGPNRASRRGRSRGTSCGLSLILGPSSGHEAHPWNSDEVLESRAAAEVIISLASLTGIRKRNVERASPFLVTGAIVAAVINAVMEETAEALTEAQAEKTPSRDSVAMEPTAVCKLAALGPLVISTDLDPASFDGISNSS